MYRQGDVLIVKVDNFPENVETRVEHDFHLAEGEVTGHYHCLVGEAIIAEHGEDVFFKVGNTELIHQEHGSISIQAGVYKKIPQFEYTPEKYIPVCD